MLYQLNWDWRETTTSLSTQLTAGSWDSYMFHKILVLSGMPSVLFHLGRRDWKIQMRGLCTIDSKILTCFCSEYSGWTPQQCPFKRGCSLSSIAALMNFLHSEYQSLQGTHHSSKNGERGRAGARAGRQRAGLPLQLLPFYLSCPVGYKRSLA